jgi:hypothetical protein
MASIQVIRLKAEDCRENPIEHMQTDPSETTRLQKTDCHDGMGLEHLQPSVFSLTG